MKSGPRITKTGSQTNSGQRPESEPEIVTNAVVKLHRHTPAYAVMSNLSCPILGNPPVPATARTDLADNVTAYCTRKVDSYGQVHLCEHVD